MLFLPVTLSLFLSFASFCGAADSTAPASVAVPAVQNGSTDTFFYVKTLKGSVNWKSDPLEPRGNITLSAQLPFTADDLRFLEDVSIPYLIILRSTLGDAEFSPGVFTCNAAGTVARAKIKEDGMTLLCKLKLKNDFLRITLRGKNGFNLPQGFGVTSTETNGWQRQKVNVEFVLLYGGHSIQGASEEHIRYSTKSGRKTKVK
jgi:hypothetical protein